MTQKFEGAIPQEIIVSGGWDSSSLQFFAQYNGVFNIRNVGLSQHWIRKYISRQYEYFCRGLFLVSTMPHKEHASRQAFSIMAKTIRQSNNEFKKMVHDANSVLIHAHCKLIPAEKVILRLPITTTASAGPEFVNLLVAADKFCVLNEILWKNGVIDHKFMFQNQSKTRHALVSVMNTNRSQFEIILKGSKHLKYDVIDDNFLDADAD